MLISDFARLGQVSVRMLRHYDALGLLVPDHVCTTVNLYRRALLLRGGAVIGETAIEAASHRLWLTEASS